METVKIKSTHPETQGDYVVINASDFDPEKHEMLDRAETKKSKPEEKQPAQEKTK